MRQVSEDDWDEDTTATDGIDAATMAKRRRASLTVLTGGSTGKIFRVARAAR